MFTDFCNKINFPNEATLFFKDLYKTISKNEATLNKFNKACDIFSFEQFDEVKELLNEVSTSVNAHEYSVHMLLLLVKANSVKALYKEKGFSEELYYSTMNDLTYKLIECKNLYGIWGTFVSYWFINFYRLERFAFGRLQYEKLTYNLEKPYKDVLKKGDSVIYCHIPSSGPLLIDDVLSSLKQAHAYYQKDFGKIVPIMCHSWLLYPPHYMLFKEGSNLRKFYDLFEVFDSNEASFAIDGWRIFNTNDEDLEKLPENTSLQVSFKKYLLDGNKMGAGYGIILFDGEKIIN